MLAAFPYERQRRVNEKYVDYYARMMEQGEWLPGTEIGIAYAPNGDGHMHGHIVNGQHRLRAVIKADVDVVFTVKSFECDDDVEVARLYGMTDTGRARNIEDYLRALSMENEFGFAPSDNIKLASAVKLILGGFQRVSRTDVPPEQQIEAMRKYSVAASAYFETLADAPRDFTHRKMRTSAVMGVALVTLDEATSIFGDDKVERFWLGIAKNDGLRIGDPRKVAHDHLFEASYRGTSNKSSNASAPYVARYVANCFNAWVEGREIKFTRVSDASAPINIAGTSFKG